MRELDIPILTYIDATVKDFDITTMDLIDTISEVTFFQDFLLPKWEKPSFDQKIKIKGVHSTTTYLELVQK